MECLWSGLGIVWRCCIGSGRDTAAGQYGFAGTMNRSGAKLIFGTSLGIASGVLSQSQGQLQWCCCVATYVCRTATRIVAPKVMNSCTQIQLSCCCSVDAYSCSWNPAEIFGIVLLMVLASCLPVVVSSEEGFAEQGCFVHLM